MGLCLGAIQRRMPRAVSGWPGLGTRLGRGTVAVKEAVGLYSQSLGV